MTSKERHLWNQIKITLTNSNVKSPEKLCADLFRYAKENDLKIKRPDGMPTNTQDNYKKNSLWWNVLRVGILFQITVLKWLTDLNSPSETSICIESRVEIEVTVADA